MKLSDKNTRGETLGDTLRQDFTGAYGTETGFFHSTLTPLLVLWMGLTAMREITGHRLDVQTIQYLMMATTALSVVAVPARSLYRWMNPPAP